MSEMLGYDDDRADDQGVNDIDTTLMAPNVPNEDNILEGHQHYRPSFALIQQYRDIFSHSVKGKAMDVPPMEFTIDHTMWETNQNIEASRDVYTEKHFALNVLLDKLLDLGVIQPSKTTK